MATLLKWLPLEAARCSPPVRLVVLDSLAYVLRTGFTQAEAPYRARLLTLIGVIL